MSQLIHIIDISSNSMESLIIPLGSVSCIRFKYLTNEKTKAQSEVMHISIYSQNKPIIVESCNGIVLRLMDGDGQIVATKSIREFEKSYLELVQVQDLYQPDVKPVGV